MPIRTQLLKNWAGPDPEKQIGSKPLEIGTTTPSLAAHNIGNGDSQSTLTEK